MSELFLDHSPASRAGRDLAAVGESIGASPVAFDGEPWGTDAAGLAFARAYLPASVAALAAWPALGAALEKLGASVVAAAESTVDADAAAARRFAS